MAIKSIKEVLLPSSTCKRLAPFVYIIVNSIVIHTKMLFFEFFLLATANLLVFLQVLGKYIHLRWTIQHQIRQLYSEAPVQGHQLIFINGVCFLVGIVPGSFKSSLDSANRFILCCVHSLSLYLYMCAREKDIFIYFIYCQRKIFADRKG